MTMPRCITKDGRFTVEHFISTFYVQDILHLFMKDISIKKSAVDI